MRTNSSKAYSRRHLLGLSRAERPSSTAWRARASADMPPPDPAVHLLSRAAFGPTPSDLAKVRAMGTTAWIDAQLDPAAVDASAVEDALRAGLPTLSMTANELSQLVLRTYHIHDALNAAMFYRQTFSPRQLHEVMVDFWSDHFSIYQLQEGFEWYKTIDDREAIRPHALGRFKDLLTASAHSPAMLIYLNNTENVKGKPNENYAREIMELHTLGVAVDGAPYTEDDVKEVARCFTGWARSTKWQDPVYGTFEFKAADHDNGPKTVLGRSIPAGGGTQDGLIVLDLLCSHPATPRFLATKLVRRFVADDPAAAAPELVERVADVYRRTDGDIAAMVRAILTSAEFASAFGQHGGKLTRPIDLVVRMMRATGVPRDGLEPVLGDRTKAFQLWYENLVGYNGQMIKLGHIPFSWLTPDGYPDVKLAWATAAGMLNRWNMAFAHAKGAIVPGFKPHEHRPQDLVGAEALADHWITTLLGRPMLSTDRDIVVACLNGAGADPHDPARAAGQDELRAVALILASPYMQWR
ncbi:MAG: DUF1800 domain-containing protein [Ardenticatenales bacterium]